MANTIKSKQAKMLNIKFTSKTAIKISTKYYKPLKSWVLIKYKTYQYVQQ